MNRFKAMAAIGCVSIMALALSPNVKAQNKKTTVKFNEMIEIPGVGQQFLPAGTYVFKLLDSQSNRHIVQIFNEGQTHVYATILAIPNYRLRATEKTVMTFDTTLYQAYQTRRFQQALKDSRTPAGRERSLLGRIEIGRLGLTAMILEGTDERTLQRAVGHIAGTPLPGRQGNVAIAGHRDTFFRALRDIRIDDEIRLTTWDGSYRYRVAFTKVVAPEDTAVLAGSDDAILTLVTCYPFYFVGPAPKRFVVRAHRIAG